MITETTRTDNLHQFIAYFEEPEPGVPMGFTGWYHSGGQFPLNGAADAFQSPTEGSVNLLKPQVVGPYDSRAAAEADLQATLSG